MSHPPRVLLAKPGLDGHDRGIKVLAMALRDAGAEVLYLGLRQSVDQILTAARDENVDVAGISVLSGAHMQLGLALLARRAELGLDDLPIVIGGTIPAADARRLEAAGAVAVYPAGSNLDDVVAGTLAAARRSPAEPE